MVESSVAFKFGPEGERNFNLRLGGRDVGRGAAKIFVVEVEAGGRCPLRFLVAVGVFDDDSYATTLATVLFRMRRWQGKRNLDARKKSAFGGLFSCGANLRIFANVME